MCLEKELIKVVFIERLAPESGHLNSAVHVSILGKSFMDFCSPI